MNYPTDNQLRDSFDYCIEFWQDAIDAENEIDLLLRELNNPRYVRADDSEA